MSFLLDLLYPLPSVGGAGFTLAIVIHSKTSLIKYPLPAYADSRILTSVLFDVHQRLLALSLDCVRHWFYELEKRRIKIHGIEMWDTKERVA